ncbi:hypothetical protein KY360_02825 [Candidatus Woesearchaeota archaeon]|nr:hypothetical protein [Candidatus Woesearchaeota archaeon]
MVPDNGEKDTGNSTEGPPEDTQGEPTESPTEASTEEPEEEKLLVIRPFDEVKADLIRLSESTDDAEKEVIRGRLHEDFDSVYPMLKGLPRGEDATLLSYPGQENMVSAVDMVAKKPKKKYVDMASQQLGRLYESYQAEVLQAKWNTEAEKLQSAVANPQETITHLRTSLSSHLSGLHRDVRACTIDLLIKYRDFKIGEDPARDEERITDSLLDPEDGYYILGYTIRIFEDVSARYNDVRLKQLALNPSIADTARTLLQIVNEARKITGEAGLSLEISCREELEAMLEKGEPSPADSERILATNNEILIQLGNFLLDAVQGTSLEGKLDYKKQDLPEREQADKPKAPRREYKRSAPSRVFSNESHSELAGLICTLSASENNEEWAEMRGCIKGMLSEAYRAIGITEAHVNEIRLTYPKEEELCSLADKIPEQKETTYELTAKVRALYEAGTAYTALAFWKRWVASLKEELATESMVYDTWKGALSTYMKHCAPESRDEVNKRLIARRRSVMGEEESQKYSDEEILLAVNSELDDRGRPDLMLDHSAIFFEVAIEDYARLANDVCKKWRGTTEFIGAMLRFCGGVSPLAGSLGITADDSDSTKLKESYEKGLGYVMEDEHDPKDVANTLGTSKNVLKQYGEIYIKILEKVAEEKQK